MGLFAELKERRLVQIVASYAATGWIALSVIDQLVDREVLPLIVYNVLLAWFLAGFVASIVIGWYHGEKGSQRAPKVEIWILSVLALGTLLFTGSLVSAALAGDGEMSVADLDSPLDPHAIGVLYLQGDGGEEIQSLADGLTEALIDELATVPSLRVATKNGAAAFRGTDLPWDSVGTLLRVGTLVHGRVQGRGDRLDVDIHLVDANSGTEFERASLTHPVGDVFAVRAGLADEVSRLLRGYLGEEIRLRRSARGTESVAAWSLVQRGEKYRKDAERLIAAGDIDRASELFDRADSILAAAESADRQWVTPITRRAQIAYRRSRLEAQPQNAEPWMNTALEHASRALELEARNPDALEVRGTVRYLRWLLALEPEHDRAEALLAGAEADLNEATRVNPRQASAWNVLAHFYYQKDDIVQANLAAQRAYEADAYLSAADDILWRLWGTSYDLEIRPQAARWCQEGRRRFPRNPRFWQCSIWNMTSGAEPADPALAWELADSALSRVSEHDRDWFRLQTDIVVAGALARANLPDSARSVLGRAQSNPDVDPTRELLLTQAFVRTLLGDEDEAIDLISAYLTANPAHREGFAEHGHWWWRSIQNNPRFRQLAS